MTDILAIVGSTKFACPDGETIARGIVAAELCAHRPGKVVSGGAKGVDTIGVAVAARLGVEYLEHLPRHRRWEPDGFKARNLLVAGTCTRLLRIVCVESTTFGSGWTALQAEKQGKPVRRIVIARDGSIADSGWPDVAAQLDLLNVNGGSSK